MDDLSLVRELYGEPEPPSPQLAVRIHNALSAGPAKPYRPARRRLRFGFGAGLVAVGAAAAVAIAVTGQGGTAHRATPNVTGPGSVGPVQLAAAKTDLLPTGKYWFSDQVVAQSYVVKAPTGDYAVSATGSEFFHWIAAQKGGGDMFYGRDLAFRPLTPQDRAALVRAGKPSTLKVWANDHYDTIVSKHGDWTADRPGSGGVFRLPGVDRDNTLTVEQLQNLPADPTSLAKQLLNAPPPTKPAGAGNGNPALDAFARARAAAPGTRLENVGQMLLNDPVPPKVQAAMMRLLTKVPGVRQIGEFTDPLNRRVVALAGDDYRQTIDSDGKGSWRTKDIGYGSEEQLLFDPDSGAFLGTQRVLTAPGGLYASQKPGFVVLYWMSRSLGWTDTKPVPPSKAPF